MSSFFAKRRNPTLILSVFLSLCGVQVTTWWPSLDSSKTRDTYGARSATDQARCESACGTWGGLSRIVEHFVSPGWGRGSLSLLGPLRASQGPVESFQCSTRRDRVPMLHMTFPNEWRRSIGSPIRSEPRRGCHELFNSCVFHT